MFSGLLYCYDCGSNMYFCTTKDFESRQDLFHLSDLTWKMTVLTATIFTNWFRAYTSKTAMWITIPMRTSMMTTVNVSFTARNPRCQVQRNTASAKSTSNTTLSALSPLKVWWGMPKNQNKPKAKKYRRDRNHAESLDNIEFFSIILKNQIILVYDPPDNRRGQFL